MIDERMPFYGSCDCGYQVIRYTAEAIGHAMTAHVTDKHPPSPWNHGQPAPAPGYRWPR